MVAILLALSLFFFPALAYLACGAGRGRIWGLLPAGETFRGEGAYRQTAVATWKQGVAPRPVRIAAFSCFVLGQMVVPGTLFALFMVLAGLNDFVLASWLHDGLPGEPPSAASPMAWVFFLPAPTGIYVACRLLSAGLALLRRAPEAVHLARRTARFALGHHVFVLVLVLATASVWGMDFPAGIPLGMGAACVALGQALLLLEGAASLEAYSAAQYDDADRRRAELEVLDAGGAS